MSTLTIRLPDDKHARLRRLANHREMSDNKLMEELATISLSEFDAETRFRPVFALWQAGGQRIKGWPSWIALMPHSPAPPRKQERNDRTACTAFCPRQRTLDCSASPRSFRLLMRQEEPRPASPESIRHPARQKNPIPEIFPLTQSRISNIKQPSSLFPMPTPYKIRQISEIEHWMGRSPDAISQMADGFLSPVTKLVGMLILEKAMLKAIDLGSAAGQACSRLQTIRQFAGICDDSEMRGKDLEFCDRIARGEQNWAMGVAAAEGAATGAMGLPGLVIDISAMSAWPPDAHSRNAGCVRGGSLTVRSADCPSPRRKSSKPKSFILHPSYFS